MTSKLDNLIKQDKVEATNGENKRNTKIQQKTLNAFVKLQNEEDKDDNKPINQDGGEQLKIWHWNVNGVRATIKSGKF